MTNTTATIIDNSRIANGIFKMVLHCADVDLGNFVPGQFADIEIPGRAELLLKRPFSINAVDANANTVTLIYQIAGVGTDALSRAQRGTEISAILPIGVGFDLKDSDRSIYLVGGGVGIAPLLSVTQRWPNKQYHAYLGYRSKDCAYCIGDFETACEDVCVSSDDGTIGEHSLITESVKRDIEDASPDIVLACGPSPMLKVMKEILAPMKIRAQFSLEQRMACGFGACATCACGIDQGNGLEYQKVCTQGPVFDMGKVVF